MEVKPKLKEYIREIYETSEGTFVFCAFVKQLQFMATLDAIEVDMSYKRVKGDINEVIFATMLTNHGKIITLCRVFTDQENSAGYKFIFRMVFELISRSIGRPIRFHYLHGEGIKAIVGDMCPKQILGLGTFLQDQDTEHHRRSPAWHLARIMIFCAIHFMRTVSKIYPNRPDGSHIERHERLNGLLLCKTERDYHKLLDLIEEHEPDLKYWVRHKRHPVIAAGLCQACSGVSPKFFSRFRPHTNAVEQIHNKSYALGTYDSLLGAVTKSLYLDQQDLDQLETREKFGIHHRYQADDIEARFGRNLQREARKREKAENQASQHREAQIQFDIDDQILLEASSSGYVVDIGRRSRSSTPRRSRSSTPRRSSSRATTRSRSRISTSPSLRRTAVINSQNQDHLNDLRELEIRQKRQEIEDSQEERRMKRQQLELETKEQELRVAKIELERQLVAAQLEQIKRRN
ncbi:uncharacterized protein N7498_008995 [Penicillium cinerascens]|uniref:Uncharacterized protein n=1 Tax=Penicillium cinerascens TaxID=70096 RepID=A0A9W9JFW4_9EURO|nr:uncharacterized protein N7498_008995 [Penicillium cinerascens]KAJ5195557.1 hypothetical protein N7498_008995 [Penicillium cinerascens]